MTALGISKRTLVKKLNFEILVGWHNYGHTVKSSFVLHGEKF
jgi:hypothetical protein